MGITLMDAKLQKVLARAGVASRRAAELLIADGRVTVDGKRATIGDRVDARADQFSVGVMAYELIVGARFYQGLTSQQLWYQAGAGGHVFVGYRGAKLCPGGAGCGGAIVLARF